MSSWQPFLCWTRLGPCTCFSTSAPLGLRIANAVSQSQNNCTPTQLKVQSKARLPSIRLLNLQCTPGCRLTALARKLGHMPISITVSVAITCSSHVPHTCTTRDVFHFGSHTLDRQSRWACAPRADSSRRLPRRQGMMQAPQRRPLQVLSRRQPPGPTAAARHPYRSREHRSHSAGTAPSTDVK